MAEVKKKELKKVEAKIAKEDLDRQFPDKPITPEKSKSGAIKEDYPISGQIIKHEATAIIEHKVKDGANIIESIGPDEAKKMWNKYLSLEKEILSDTDYLYFVSYKYRSGSKVYSSKKAFANKKEADAYAKEWNGTIEKRKTKTAFRKLATFYNLSIPQSTQQSQVDSKQVGNFIVQMERGEGFTSTSYMDLNLNIVKADVTVFVSAPNGRVQMGRGVCAATERSFNHPDHDIPSTAFTRALNRAISDMIGYGEVSAEEVSDGKTLLKQDEYAGEDLSKLPDANKEIKELKVQGTEDRAVLAQVQSNCKVDHNAMKWLTVKKAGKNQGRQFRQCAVCKLWNWRDEFEKKSAPVVSPVTVTNEDSVNPKDTAPTTEEIPLPLEQT